MEPTGELPAAEDGAPEPVTGDATTERVPENVRWTRRLGRAFWNQNERRLRAFWRLSGHTLLTVGALVAIGVVVALATMLRAYLGPSQHSRFASLWRLVEPSLAVATVLQGAVATGVTWLARRVLDRRPFGTLGLRRSGFVVRDLAFGIALSGVMIAAAFVILLACGWLRLGPPAWETSSAGAVLASLAGFGSIFVCVGWYEELLSRGYWFVNLRDGIGVRTAAVVSSSVFALGHVGNPNATLASTASLVGAGLLLAWCVVRTGQLWMSIGMHVGWNFFEGPVFGFPVSGIQTFTLVRHEMTGPPLLTGGAFGPEAGLLLLAIQGLGALVVWWATRERPIES